MQDRKVTDSGGKSMRDALVENLEAQVAELQQRLQEAEQDGAEIAGRYAGETSRLQTDNDRLSEESNPVYCKGCEKKRRQAACGLTMVWLYLYVGSPQFGKEPPGEFFETLAFIFLPPLLVWCRWHVLLYLRQYHYRGWKDNDIVRAIRNWYDGLPES
jgi:hypothetical protein